MKRILGWSYMFAIIVIFCACASVAPVSQQLTGVLDLKGHPISLEHQGVYSKEGRVKLVNIETRTEKDFLIGDTGQRYSLYTIYKDLTGMVIEYMAEELEKRDVRVDDNSNREIHVALERIKFVPGKGRFVMYGFATLKIDIPETGYSGTYETKAGSGWTAFAAMNSAIIYAVLEFLKDPEVIDYLQFQ